MSHKVKSDICQQLIDRVSRIQQRMESLQVPGKSRLQDTYTPEEYAELNACLADYKKHMSAVIDRLNALQAQSMDAKMERDIKHDTKLARDNLLAHGVEDASVGKHD